MSEPLDEQYINWLYHQVASVRLKNPARTYWSLIRELYTKEFVWLIPNDDNRVEDGRDLRYEFLKEYQPDVDPDIQNEWMGFGCSMLEMMIGLSRRISFEDEAERDVKDWFWILIENLDLRDYNDVFFKRNKPIQQVSEILDQVIWRTYAPDGRGGLFPMNDPQEDQRDVELWYQLSMFLIERT